MRLAVYIAAFLSLWTVESVSQLRLERAVISPFALNGTLSLGQFYTNGGEASITTLSSPNHIFTQGFEQPLPNSPLSFEVSVVYNECIQAFELAVSDIQGCANSAEVTFTWNGSAGDSIFTTTADSVYLQVMSALGCFNSWVDSYSMEEVPHISCDLGFYNMITPNGDTSNETWIIENIEEPFYEGNEVAIYNRYGQLVWQIENYNNLDRVFEGKGMDHQLLPDGTYFFEVTYASGQKTGFLEVQR